MVLLHPSVCSKPAAVATIELSTGLRSVALDTRAGNYVVGLIDPKAIPVIPKTKPRTLNIKGLNPDDLFTGPFGGNAA
jgi:hypothetical protein